MSKSDIAAILFFFLCAFGMRLGWIMADAAGRILARKMFNAWMDSK